ncbi:MAG TPA: type II toxin-antitoxin system HicA family toxin [Gammaproteobacteria bacterium]|nr:type II toxin-antitoxin system HicA family toxin [Gammaproteobacteria bacterium]
MPARRRYSEVLEALQASKANLRCGTLAEQLARLGFEVRNGKRGGHKVFFHDGISAFTSGSYNCGHGKNPKVKPAYIRKVLKILHQYETEIIGFLERIKS